MKRNLLLFSLLALVMGFGAKAQTKTYSMVTSTSELYVGAKVLLVGYNDAADSAFMMSYQKSNNRHAVYTTQTGSSISTSVAVSATSETEPFEFTVGGNEGAWTFYDELKSGYLYAAGGGNYLKTQTNLDSKGEWTISMTNGACVFTSNGGVEQCYMRFNINHSGSPLFGCYKPTSNVSAPVYIFMAGDHITLDPEPSSYPTQFTAEADRNTINLAWAASTGAQLPRGYLVLGSTGTITVPTDGTPVANDIDAADGNIAFNVMSGTEVEFKQLAGNTTYNFAIFPFTNTGDGIDYKTDGTYPTASATTANSNCLLDVDFDGALAPFTAYNVTGQQEWSTSVYDNVPFAKMSGYASGASNVNEDWLISPDLFRNGAYKNVTISFSNCFNFDGDALKVMMSSEYDGVSDPTEYNWQDITSEFAWSEGGYVWQESGAADFNVEGSYKLYIAFRYTSTAAAASTWEVTNVEVYGTVFDAVDEVSPMAVSIYPNPATSCFKFNAENDVTVEIIDVTGRMVMSVEAKAGENTVNISELSNGVYFAKIGASVVKLVKE